MRTGREYKQTRRDGRQLWILGEGLVDDIAAHRATSAMVDHYAGWYDRHCSAVPDDVRWTAPDSHGVRRPLAFETPRSVEDLRSMGRAFHAEAFATAGNVTHTPGYGALIALGIVDLVRGAGLPPARIAAAERYREALVQDGRFLTYSFNSGPVGDRFRSPTKAQAMRLVKETDSGIIVSGMVGVHTATPYADEVFIWGGGRWAPDDHCAWFCLPLSSPGVRIIARRPVGSTDTFVAPISARFDELDAALWLDDVFVPSDRVFAVGPECASERRGDGVVSWLLWHQQIGWLARSEFTLGLALALFEAMALKHNPAALDLLMELVTQTQTIRSCLTAAELDPEPTRGGYLRPGMVHLAPASIYTIKMRQRSSEILRLLAGAAAVIAPTATDLAGDELAPGLELSLGGGDHTATQRAALLNLVWDHLSSGVDSREASFELFANGGIAVWLERMRRHFDRYDVLANGILPLLSVDMPRFELDYLRRDRPDHRR